MSGDQADGAALPPGRVDDIHETLNRAVGWLSLALGPDVLITIIADMPIPDHPRWRAQACLTNGNGDAARATLRRVLDSDALVEAEGSRAH